MTVPRQRLDHDEQENLKRAVFGVYQRMRDKGSIPYEITYAGLKLHVHPTVYDPEPFDDSRWFAGAIRYRLNKNETLLEIGTGTGFIGLWCAMHGAIVTATDINPAAVDNAKRNAARYRANMRVCFGDMYAAVPKGAKFDIIFWAHPFNNWEIDVTGDPLLATGVDPGYRSLEKYIAGAKAYLAPGGSLLLGTGDTADIGHIERIAAKYGYRLELLSKSQRPLGRGAAILVTDLLCAFVPLGK